jgi:hypothetical protein
MANAIKKSLLAILIKRGLDPTSASKETVPNYKLVDNNTSNGHSEGKFVELAGEGLSKLLEEGESLPAFLEEIVASGIRVRFIEADNSYKEKKGDSMSSLLEQLKSLGG